MPNQMDGVYFTPPVPSCPAYEPNSIDGEYAQPFRHIQYRRTPNLCPIATLQCSCADASPDECIDVASPDCSAPLLARLLPVRSATTSALPADVPESLFSAAGILAGKYQPSDVQAASNGQAAMSDTPALKPHWGNPPYGILGRAMETSASFEARYAPLLYPTNQVLSSRPTFRTRESPFGHARLRFGRRRSGKSSSQNSLGRRSLAVRVSSSSLRNCTRRILPEMVLGKSQNSIRRMRL
jgi:hypothetical protein